jgi:hypothetical protein
MVMVVVMMMMNGAAGGAAGGGGSGSEYDNHNDDGTHIMVIISRLARTSMERSGANRTSAHVKVNLKGCLNTGLSVCRK